MRKLFMSLISVAAITSALPAAAQDWRGGYDRGGDYGYRPDAPVRICGDGDGDEREDYAVDGGFGQRRLHGWIDHAAREGRLNGWEVRRLQWRVNQLAGWEARICSKGYANDWEHQRLMQAYRGVAGEIWREIHAHDGYGYQGGWGYRRPW